MFYTSNIYRYMQDALMYQGYRDLREVPVEIIKDELKKYLMINLFETNESLDLDTLFLNYENYIDKKDKPKIMGSFIHYILSYMSLLQGFEIVWYIDDLQEEAIFKESNFYPGKIEGLVTKKDINYLATFNYCLQKAEKLKEERRGRH